MTGLSSLPSACDRARQWVSLRLDGELSQVEGALLDAHLDECAACAAFAGDVVATARLLRDDRLDAPTRPMVLPRRRRPLARPLGVVGAAAASVAVALGVAGGLGSEGSQLDRSRAGKAPVVLNPVHGGENILLRQPRLAQLHADAARSQQRRGLGIPI